MMPAAPFPTPHATAFANASQRADGGDAPTDSRSAAGAAKRRFGFWLRVAITIGLVALLAWRVDGREVVAALRNVHWGYWGLAFATYLVSQAVSARRWAGLARALGFAESYPRFLKLYFEGVFFNQCLPSSIGGDVVKAVRLGQTPGERVLAGGTVLADRLTGLAALLVLALTGVLQEALSLPGGGVAAVAGALTLAALAGARLAVGVVGWFAQGLGPGRPAGRMLARFEPYRRRPSILYRAIGWSFVVQILVVVQVMLLGRSLEVDAPWTAYLIAAPTVSLISTVPASIGGIGLREGGLVELLAPYGVRAELGVAVGLLWFLVALSSGLLGGAAYLWERKSSAPSAP